MNRRDMLKTTAAATLALGAPHRLWGSDVPDDLRITRIRGFELESERPKLVGKNSFRDVHGRFARDPVALIETNAGIEGFGHCRAGENELRPLLGKDPLEFYRKDAKRMAGPLGAATMPLWDLAGKALKQPVWKLLGGKGQERVGVYDGSIYFADLLPGHEQDWRDQFRREIDMGREKGHTVFKVKIGRGKKWMPRDAGDRRDAEVVALIWKHGGGEIEIGVDANNGYDLAGAKEFLKRVADVPLAFVEEMFPE
ncbi:MAG: enolase C-terminal domain-like protein, partial [Planctomycetaceae bacterium]